MKKTAAALLIAIVISAVPVFTSCSDKSENESGLKIVCSIFPQYDFCRIITGTEENLTLLQKNGTDMHSYEPTSGDILEIARCDILVYTGGQSDAWVDGVLRSAEIDDIITCSLFDYVDLLYERLPEYSEHGGDSHDHSGEVYDEHVWMSVTNAVKIVRGLTEIICQADPENKDKYTANSEKYIESLNALDKDFRKLCENPRTIIVGDRFPFLYFTEEYGIDYYAAFPGCSAETEASFETVTFLINKAKELQAEYIFQTDDSNQAVAQKIAEDTGARVLSLYSCQSITDEQFDNGESYLSLMRKNLQTLTEAWS